MKAVAIFLSGCVAGAVAMAGDWPAWRGPAGTGATPETGPVAGAPLWKVELPGRGCSTPIVWDDRIHLTTPIDGQDGLIVFGMDGEELWRKSFGKATPGRGQRVGSSANSSPVTDGETIFVYFKSGNFAAVDLKSQDELWSFNVFERYGENHLWWDVGTSPVLAGGNIVLAVMQTEGDSFLVSLDKKTGEEVWKTDREFETGKESGDAYTTPLVREVEGRETIITWGADHLTGHDAQDGELLWTCGGFNPGQENFQRVIASATATDGVIVVPFGRGKSLAGVKPGGRGDVTEEAVLWTAEVGTDASTPVGHDGRVYVLTDSDRDRGTVTCVDAENGGILWTDRLPKAPQIYYASPVVAGERFYCLREDGMLFQAMLGGGGLVEVEGLEVGENTIASPVPVDGKLLVRGDRHLMCFGD